MADSFRSVLTEDRTFTPPSEFRAQARLSDPKAFQAEYRHSIDDPEGYWSEKARDLIPWMKPFTETLRWDRPYAKWFVDGEVNAAHVCVDQHLATWRRNKAAIIFEGEPGDVRTLTFQQLHSEVCKAANALLNLGLQKGDKVALYMPMVPEAAIAMLACARIGCPHTVVFGGFSSESLRERINDAECKAVITADGGYRRGQPFGLKAQVDAAVEGKATPTVKSVLVLRRTGQEVNMVQGRDHWWHETVDQASHHHEAQPMEAEHPLFLLYTSGSTGKPKGIQHSTAGYLVGTTLTSQVVFDLRDEDVYWCTADVGWITGHSYIVYGPLSNGATVMMYEGAPNHPDFGRFWDIVERHKVTVFYTAPTAIRAFIKAGDHYPNARDLSSLRLLGSVGEPINPEAWMWYHRVIGKERCPIVDTWWQTETGAIMITPVPGLTETKPGSATHPFIGIDADIWKEEGTPTEADEGGYLVIKKPWPSMLRTIYGDNERYEKTYWSKYNGEVYFAGDSARRDKDGYLWIMGRVDDVLNVSGHRLGTAEIESSLVGHEAVAEAAVVGRPDDLKGQAVVAFVTLKAGFKATSDMEKTLRDHVGQQIGAIAKPDDIRLTEALPKTRSGKIMRRLLKEVAAGNDPTTGDLSTLEDRTILEKLVAPKA
ncbi:MAG: acetate--CoA ligase [Myxococcota bacterium]